MPLSFNTRTLSSRTLRPIIYRSLLLLLALSLLAGTLTAQSDQETKQAEAERLFSEGMRLFDEGSQESLKQALQKFEKARLLFRSVKATFLEAVMNTATGRTYYMLGEKKKALDYFEQALPLYRAVADRQGEATTLNSIGAVNFDLGEEKKALDYYAQALSLVLAIDDRQGVAAILNNIGKVYADFGERQEALDYFAQALPLYRAISDRKGESAILNRLGTVYSALGEKQKALDYFEQALSLYRAIADRQGEADALNNMGMVYEDLDEMQKALDYFEQALPIRRVVGDRDGEAATLLNIGVVYISWSDDKQALFYLEQALHLYRAIGDRNGEAGALNNIGAVYFDLGEKQKAIDHHLQALSLTRALGNRQDEASALYNIAYVEYNLGHLNEARARMETALAIIESLRIKITNQNLRTSYFATVQHHYEVYIDLLMRLYKEHPTEGYDGEALRVSERARARALLETLSEANADIRQGVDPKLVEREHALRQQINMKAQEQMKLFSGSYTEAQSRIIAKEIEALTMELQQVETRIRQTSPRYAALTQPQPLTLKEIQTQVLDADTLLLEYSLGMERSYLWAVTPGSIKSYELPKRAEIETAARRVYDILSARNQRLEGETQAQREARIALADAQYAEAGAHLSRIVLAPVATQLGDKRLLIAGDGALQYIPFAALPDPASAANSAAPLVVKHEVVSLPSASTISALRRETKGRTPAVKTIAVLADPVFELDDERVKANASKPLTKSGKTISQAGNQAAPAPSTRQLVQEFADSAKAKGTAGRGWRIPRLPGTRQEAAQLLALVPATEGKQALDFAASRATITSPDLSQYRYLHFATHGFLDTLHPELSGVVLSMVDEKGNPQDGFLRAHEVFNLKLPAELIVLSACQTGLGKEIKGEGLVGLTRGFMYAGAPRVVVSLWSVSDKATAELMTRFYRGMLKEGKRPAAALRDAQVSLMNDKRWAVPFYWAPFTLQGEWR